MELWLWVIAVVVGFTLLSGFFSRYYRDGEESEPLTDGARSAGENGSRNEGHSRPNLPPEDGYGHPRSVFFGAPGETAVARTADGSTVDEGRRCRRCGAVNEASPAFTYCRECVRPLS